MKNRSDTPTAPTPSGASAAAFKLAHDCRYTPDFMIQENDGALRLEETKGHWEEDARIKCRVMAETFPIPLRALVVDKATGGWKIEVFR